MALLYDEYLRVGREQGLTFKQYLAVIGYTNPAENFRGMDDAATFRRDDNGLALISIPEQPVRGQLRIKVLLIDFTDREGTLPVSHYERLLFSKGTHPTGSLRDYYQEVSLGQVDVTGSIHGWLRMPQPYSFYTNGESGTEWQSYPRNAPRMAEDAVNIALGAGVSFEPELDLLGQGIVTALFIVHAGLGAEGLHPSIRGNHIWSHKWIIRQPIEVGPNLTASTYLTVPNDAKVGVCAHELGHLAFQWEDFYDPNYDEDGKEWDGSGSWDLMAGGSYNGSGARPAHPAGLHKTQHGWVEVEDIRSSRQLSLAPYSATSGKVVKLVSPVYRAGQYLLLENRRKQGFDSDLPGEGLLVWRVDETKQMFAPEKPALLLIQADGRHQLQNPSDWNTGDAGDPFPGNSDRDELSDRGDISTSFPDGEDSGISLQNIQRDPFSGVVSLDIVFADGTTEEEPGGTTTALGEASPEAAIPDNSSVGVESLIELDADGLIEELAVEVDISHTYIGDLRVALTAPSGQTVLLHNRTGQATHDLRTVYRSSATPALAGLVGTLARGVWRLRVTDHAGFDTGTLNRWSLAVGVREKAAGLHLQAQPEARIPDNDPAGIGSVLRVTRAGMVKTLTVSLDITHTFIGDLRVELLNPRGDRAMLHNQSGGGQANLQETYRSADTVALGAVIGQPVRGDWTLRVADLAGQDIGTLNRWSLDIELAADVQVVEHEATPRLAIPDDDSAGIGSTLAVDRLGTVQSVEVSVGITHTYIGDLRVELLAPSGERALLHNRDGGRTRNLSLELNSSDFPALGALVGQPVRGNWILRVADLEGLDTGTLDRWSLRIAYASGTESGPV